MRGGPDTALEHYRRALDLMPDLGLAWMGIAKSLVAAGRPAEAIPACEKLLKFWPNNGGILVELADAYASAGEESRAAQAFDLALRVDPAGTTRSLQRAAEAT